MYELKKWKGIYEQIFLGPGPRLVKKIISRAAVSQMLRNIVLEDLQLHNSGGNYIQPSIYSLSLTHGSNTTHCLRLCSYSFSFTKKGSIS